MFEPCSRTPTTLRSLEPRSAISTARAPRRTRARTAARALLFAAPWLLLAACSGDDDGLDGPGEVVGDSSAPSAGTGGRMSTATGGTTNVLPPSGSGGATGTATGNAGRAGGAGSTSSDGGNGGLDGDLPAAPGETGIFVGMTAAHNAVRQGLDLDPPLPDLTWNQDLSDFAQQWADTLANSTNCGTIFHRDQRMYGENIAFAGIRGAGSIMYPPEDAVASWAEEVLCWDYGTILGNGQPTASSESCDAMCIAKQHSSGCGHYTQLVWRNTREVGCGYATCVSSDGFSDGIWVCNYSPPGNFIGQTPY